MKSPFEELKVDRSLVCGFFAVFARFEYAMKATRYCRGDRHGIAVPDWNSLTKDLGDPIAEHFNDTPNELIDYLLFEPPEVQMFIDGSPKFEAMPLDGANRGAQAIDAAKRVRNNYFMEGSTRRIPPQNAMQS